MAAAPKPAFSAEAAHERARRGPPDAGLDLLGRWPRRPPGSTGSGSPGRRWRPSSPRTRAPGRGRPRRPRPAARRAVPRPDRRARQRQGWGGPRSFEGSRTPTQPRSTADAVAPSKRLLDNCCTSACNSLQRADTVTADPAHSQGAAAWPAPRSTISPTPSRTPPTSPWASASSPSSASRCAATSWPRPISGPAEEARGTLEVLGAVVGERVKLVEERVTAAIKR